ncbi:uncharacterized protein VP01_3274g1 [Puccinia sorghi]|uniref:Uncharacterized protein n=1 Tax=Puccinia sorghi TaxID=27349 RepID=A0A0L6UZM2_9BASI|nr:uncharacterized protein VP01_3274g1 [Puccinia sorghi]
MSLIIIYGFCSKQVDAPDPDNNMLALYSEALIAMRKGISVPDEVLSTSDSYTFKYYHHISQTGFSNVVALQANLKLLCYLSVSKSGRLAKFTLTQQGFEVGSILAEQESLSLLPFNKSTLSTAVECPLMDSTHSEPNISGDSLPKASSLSTPRRLLTNPTLMTLIPQTSPSRKLSIPKEAVFRIVVYSNSGILIEVTGLQVRNMDDADTRMHPRTFETLYQVEFANSQVSHPVKRSSIADKPPLCPTTMTNLDHMTGWIYESKALPNCAGFGLSTHSPTMSTSAIADQSSSMWFWSINLLPHNVNQCEVF